MIVAEPGAAYARRSPLVADCSVIAALVFNEAERDSARKILGGHDVHVPTLIDYEIANVAVKKARHGFEELASQALNLYADFRLTRYELEVNDQWRVAMKHDLSAYDAAYLWLAGALGVPLATFDQKLGRAAQKSLGEIGPN
ncbi:MAG: type II toxin-antitoxin system VapC family toxin [Wenzhouxiangellaceae bacterium]